MAEEPKPWTLPVAPKQLHMIRDQSQLLLADGPRRSGKTIGLGHKAAHHLWNIPGAVGMMLGYTITKNATEGAWVDMRKTILPSWIEADFGMQFLDPHTHSPLKSSRDPCFIEGTTKRMYMEISNRFYDKDVPEDWRYSRIFLDSLSDESPNGEKVETRYKSKRFSFIWVTELSDFRYRSTLDILTECLRMYHLRPNQHQLVADTNPAPEGEDSWIWKIWYWLRGLDLDHLEEDELEELDTQYHLPKDEADRARALSKLKTVQKKLSLHHFTLDDNPYITQDEKDDIWVKYGHNVGLRDRYYYGLWTKSTGEGLFSEVWRPNIHIVGQARGLLHSEAEMAVPQEDAIELGMGLDPGPVNFAASFVEKFPVEVTMKGSTAVKTGFLVFDEFASIGKPLKLEEATEELMDKIAYWEKFLNREVLWRFWADQSAFASYQSIANTSEAKEMFSLSDGKIALRAFKRLPGSVAERTDLMIRLLFENRLFVSAARCPQTIEMFERLKRKRTSGTIDRASPQKHIFDSLSYYVCMESWSEIASNAFAHIRRNKEPARIIRTRI